MKLRDYVYDNALIKPEKVLACASAFILMFKNDKKTCYSHV